jgi:hypothetical protein
MRTPAFSPSNPRVFLGSCRTGSNLAGRFPGETPPPAQLGWRSKVIVRLGRMSPMVTDDYRGLPKGRVRPVSANPRGPLPEWEPRSRHPDAKPSCRCRRLSRSDRSYSGKGFSAWVRTRSSLRDLNSFFHFPQRRSAGLSADAPPGLDSSTLGSTGLPENEFSRTCFTASRSARIPASRARSRPGAGARSSARGRSTFPAIARASRWCAESRTAP